MIHFNNLPTENPNTNKILPAGRYYAEITKAEMRESKTTPGSKYLNVQFRCYNNSGDSAVVYDKLFDSDKPLLKFKLAQFLRALPNTFSGDFELSDLPKIIVGKTVIAQLKVTAGDANYSDKNEVDIFDTNIFSRYGAFTEEPADATGPFDPRDDGVDKFDPEKEDY